MRQLLVAFIGVISFPLWGICDVIEIANGDRISGTVQSMAEGRLGFETPYAGSININWREIRSITTTGDYEVEFSSGRRVTGAILPVDDGVYRVGDIPDNTFRPDEIVAIRKPPEDPNIGILENWDATADFGYTTTRGNSRSTQLAIQFQPQRRTDKDSIKADIQSLRSMVNGGAGTSTHSAEARYDRFLTPRIFVFGVGKAEHDQRELLQLRSREGGGFGFRLRPTESTTISAFGGSTFVQENFKGQPLRYSGEGLLGYEFETALLGWRLTSKAQILPSFADAGRYRAEWDSGLRVPFSRGLNFGVRLFHRYDSHPQPGVKKSDYGVVSTIGFTF